MHRCCRVISLLCKMNTGILQRVVLFKLPPTYVNHRSFFLFFIVNPSCFPFKCTRCNMLWGSSVTNINMLNARVF